jgi:hypothetical protein
MRLKAILLTLTLAVLAANAFAAEGLGWWSNPWTESFRSASTASLLEDDLDVMLDPAGLTTLEGYRLYTNLSNLVDKNDDVFDNNSNGYYLLGGSSKVMGFGYAGLLYDRYADSYRDTTMVNSSNYVDNDGNGTYDSRTVSDAIASDYYKNVDSHWWLGYGRNVGAGKFGALIYHRGATFNYQPWGSNSTGHVVVTDLVTGYTTSDINIEYTNDSLITHSVFGGALSYWMPMGDKIDLGLAGGLNIQLANLYDTLTYSYSSTNPSAGATNGTTTDSTVYKDMIPEDNVGLQIDVRGAAIYKWNENVKTRTDLTFSMLTGEHTDGSITSDYSSLTAFQLPTGVQSTSTARSYTSTPVTQDNSRMSIGLFSKTTAKLGEKVVMAMGLGFGTATRDYSTKFNREYSQVVVYNDGDPALLNDYTQITNGAMDYAHIYTTSSYYLNAPVGLEFNITQPFVFRLGASPVFYSVNYSDNTTMAYTPDRTINIDGAGDTTQTITTPFATTNGVSYNDRYSEISVNYSYGAGWKISENLQIDLMGFALLDDMTNWKLSAILKF